MQYFTILNDQVRPYEVDFENIVHHANYLIWCENSRFHFFDKIVKTPIHKFKSEHSIDIVILEANVNYMKSFKLGDTYYVKSRIEKISNLKFKFIDYVYDDNHKLCVKGEFISVGIDSVSKKPNKTLISSLDHFFSTDFINETESVIA
ncbi:acyl-CoA thioesterase [Thiotrichales bacterium 19S11-10]|nr:acyl-CoA thioesterase [Thiotrichales bacterium 19S11-10]